jgi:hypothetical protein
MVGFGGGAGWARADGHAGACVHDSTFARHVRSTVHVTIMERKFYRWLSSLVGFAAIYRGVVGAVDITLGRTIFRFTKVPNHALEATLASSRASALTFGGGNMKHLLSALLILTLASPITKADELVRFSGHLIKYDQPAGTPKARFCLQARDHVQGNLHALWLVDVDLSHLEKDTKILVEGVIRTKLIPEKGGISSIPSIWEVWMEVKRYKVIQDFTVGDFSDSKAEPSAPANGASPRR